MSHRHMHDNPSLDTIFGHHGTNIITYLGKHDSYGIILRTSITPYCNLAFEPRPGEAAEQMEAYMATLL